MSRATSKNIVMGRPTKYKPGYCQKIVEYFSIEPYEEKETTITDKSGNIRTEHHQVANDLRFLSGFAHTIGVTHTTIDRWAKRHDDFSVALKKAKELQQIHLVTNGLKGLYQTAFAIFTAKNITEWRDKNEALINIDNTKQYVQIYRPEPYGREKVETSCRPTDRSV